MPASGRFASLTLTLRSAAYGPRHGASEKKLCNGNRLAARRKSRDLIRQTRARLETGNSATNNARLGGCDAFRCDTCATPFERVGRLSRTATEISPRSFCEFSRPRPSELLGRHLPNSKIVKAFNAIQAAQIESNGRPKGSPDRRALPIASDDPPKRSWRIFLTNWVRRRGRWSARRGVAVPEGREVCG